eukprot:CAMPEP_0172330970 /NCGR_PEP_ID=MMETSP1058-20130122/61684_1 /TAXON_ID=83371 /ORGANISM="Detonula confervacea, Strain CCMP 353" /LENGTH=579 /DNA_ID=CAMNT_0013048213 /DNA_START=320 /DNA_END=2059 /DNA_ORIENTATION=-
MKSYETRGDAAHSPGTMRQKPMQLINLLVILHIIRLPNTTNGFTTPMAKARLAPSSHYRAQRRSLSPHQFDYRNSHQQSAIQESVATNKMSKIKSPSNDYSEFLKEGVLVGIESTSFNARRISGEILVDIPIDDIWEILTDYDNLSTHVPNLVESKVINDGSRILGGGPRVYQRGAQRIFGFQFGADLTLDMTECVQPGQYSIDFECVDSQFFSQFDGSWILEEYTDGVASTPKTMVRYIVDVKPKGPVPVAALEWRIKEDVPLNILAVSKSARAKTELEPVPPQQSPPQPQSNPLEKLTDKVAYNPKQTANYVLPTYMLSTARRALKVMEFTMSLNGGRSGFDVGNKQRNPPSADYNTKQNANYVLLTGVISTAKRAIKVMQFTMSLNGGRSGFDVGNKQRNPPSADYNTKQNANYVLLTGVISTARRALKVMEFTMSLNGGRNGVNVVNKQSNPPSADYNTKRTANYVLPTRVTSTAKRAIKVMQFTMSLNGGRSGFDVGNKQRNPPSADYNTKQNANYVLLTGVISTAKRAIKVMEFTMSLNGGRNGVNVGNTQSNAQSADRSRSNRLSSSFWVQP